MGGEVIIITKDPDVQDPSPVPEPRVQVSQVQLLYGDSASASEVAAAVHKVLTTAKSVREG